MQRVFEDETFRAFVMSDELLAQREALATALRSWMSTDITHAAKLAQAYLPRNARIRATVYPAIKPAKNSFVFEIDSNPAIFMYVEPLPRETFEATIAHEMHHIGYGTACPSLEGSQKWFGAFGEGVATLAAAGGPNGIPQRKPDVMKEWTSQMSQTTENFRALDEFFLAMHRGELTGEELDKRAFSFYGFVGPWYTVGWKMGVVIEKTLGRQALIDTMCDPRPLFATYN